MSSRASAARPAPSPNGLRATSQPSNKEVAQVSVCSWTAVRAFVPAVGCPCRTLEQVFTVVGELVAANANQRYGAVAVLAASQGSRDGPAGETGETGEPGGPWDRHGGPD